MGVGGSRRRVPSGSLVPPTIVRSREPMSERKSNGKGNGRQSGNWGSGRHIRVLIRSVFRSILILHGWGRGLYRGHYTAIVIHIYIVFGDSMRCSQFVVTFSGLHMGS